MQKQDDQHEYTFSNYVRIRDVVQKTCLRRWKIGKSGERGSGISVLPARYDDDVEVSIVKLVTVGEVYPKVPFSIATTPRCREGCNFFPWKTPLYSYFIILSVKQGDIKYHFLSFWYDSTWDWTPVSRTIGEHSYHCANGLVSQVGDRNRGWPKGCLFDTSYTKV